jgi:TolA-binding protein
VKPIEGRRSRREPALTQRRSRVFVSFLTWPAAFFLAATVSLSAQEIRRAIPVEPRNPPLVPFEIDTKPAATPTPVAKPRPTPRPTPVPPAATPAPVVAPIVTAEVRAAPGAPMSPEQMQLDYANGLYARKMFDMAAPEYEKYLGQYSKAAERQTAWFRLGECYREIGNVNAAKSSYANVVNNSTTGEFIGPAAYRLADLYFQEKNYREALQLYRKASVRVKDPSLANSAKYNMARCLENQREKAEARAIYEDLATIKENNPFREASRLAVAQIFNDAGRKADALKQFEILAQETSSKELKAESLVKAGLLEIDLDHRDKAAADLKKALALPEIGKWKEIAQLGLLRMLYDAGKYKEALHAYETGAAAFSDEARPEALLIAANSRRQLGEHTAARELYDRVIHDYPDTVYAKEAQYDRLVSLYANDDPDVVKAVDDYLAANPEPEKRDQVTLLKAESLFKKQKYSAAAPIYATIEKTKLAGTFKADALYKLGWCYMETNDFDRAAKVFTDFLDTYTGHKLTATALAQRALAYQQQKKFTAALKDFDSLISKFPNAKERELALQQKALILGQQQDNAGMAAAFQQLLNDYPKSPAAAQANYWIGWAASEAKDYKRAIAPLDAARKADREQFFERATQRIMIAHYNLEEKEPLAAEIDHYIKGGGKDKVPTLILRWLGGQFLAAKEFAKAEKYLAMLTAREGEATPDDSLNLGRSQLQQQKFAEAVKAFRVYLESAREPFPHAMGLLALGRAQLGLKQFDDAQKTVDQACGLQPEGSVNAEGRELLGDIEMGRGDFDKAARAYRSVAVIVDDPVITPRAMEKAWDALKRSGNDKEAAKVLNELQSRYPEYQLKSATAK